jgi:adenylate cyclase
MALMIDSDKNPKVCVLVIDLVDSVQQMQHAEAWCIDVYRRFSTSFIANDIVALNGRVVKSLGDGLMLEFASATNAVNAAFAAMHRLALTQEVRNKDGSEPELLLRAGIHRTEVVVGETDIYGAGVNLAARLAALGAPKDVVISLDARTELLPGFDADVEDLGLCYLRGFDRPIRCFRATKVEASLRLRPTQLLRETESLQPTIAILYFDPLMASTEQLVIADLVAESLIGCISRTTRLKVISRLSAKGIAGRDLGYADVAKLLRADFIVSGSFRPVGETVHLNIELVRSRDETVIWSEEFSVEVSALMQKDSAYAKDIATKVLGSIIRAESEAALHTPMPTLPSCALLTAAISSMHNSFDKAWFSKSAEMLGYLIDRHPRHPEPYAWMAKWSVLRVVQGMSDSISGDVESAYRAAATALQLSPTSPLALTMAGLVHAYLRHDFAEAEKAYDLALLSNPNESLAMLLKGTMHAFRAEGSDAVMLTEASLMLSPLDPQRYFYESLGASAAISAGNYGRAVELATSSIRLNRSHASTWRALAIAQSLLGNDVEAQAAVKGLTKLEPNFTVSVFKARFPGRDYVPEYLNFLGKALEKAGVPV